MKNVDRGGGISPYRGGSCRSAPPARAVGLNRADVSMSRTYQRSRTMDLCAFLSTQ
jgi:hypothetical protein